MATIATLLADVWALLGVCLALVLWAGLKWLFPVAPSLDGDTGTGRESAAAWTFLFAFGTAAAGLSGVVYVIWPEPERGGGAPRLWLAGPCLGGLATGGFFVLLEPGVHARRRAMLREVIRRADELSAAGPASSDRAESGAVAKAPVPSPS